MRRLFTAYEQVALAQKYTDFYFELLPEIDFDEEEIRQLTEKVRDTEKGVVE